MSKTLSHDFATPKWHLYCLVAFATCCSMSIPKTGFAQNWQFQPTVSVTANYNDNIRLNEEGQQGGTGDRDVTGGTFWVGARVWRQSPTGIARFRPAVRSSHYGTDADSDDYFLDVFLQHVTPKSEWALEARYSDEEVLSAELEDPDFDNPDIDSPVNDDSGFVTTENRRDRIVLSPRVIYRLSERTSLLFRGQLLDTGYDSGATSFSDYTNQYYAAGIGRALSQKNQVQINVFGRKYDPDIVGSNSDSYGAFATFQRRTSERNVVFFRAGYERVEIRQLSGGQSLKRTKGSAVFGAGVRRSFETSRMVLDVRRTVTPSGLAQLRERNMFRARYVRELSERTRATITARYEDTNSISDSASFADRDFIRLEFRLERRLSRAWTAIGGYSYTEQDFSDAASAQDSNAIFLGVRYSPPRQQ